MTGPLPTPVVLRVFAPFALGYFLSYLFRTVNAVIAPDLARDVGLDAGSLGLLTSVYFLTFAAFQLPLGLLLDRYGPKKVESALLIFAAIGAAVFAVAETEAGLIAGRALIGFGVSACLMAAFKSFAIWFPKEKLPLANGCQMAAGGLGALTATAPVEAALAFTDWRGVFFGLAVLSLVVSATVFLVVPDKDTKTQGVTLKAQWDGLKSIYQSAVFWRVAPLTVVSQSGFLSIQSLWSGPWLRDVAGLDRAAVADHLFWIAAFMVAGFLGLGAAAERISKWGLKPLWVALFGMGLFMVAETLLVLGWTGSPMLLWVAFAFFGTTGILPYAALSQCFPPELAGRVNTSINLMVFAMAFAWQWAIGWMIGLKSAAGSETYAPEGYSFAFAVVLGSQVLAFLWLILWRKAPLPLKD